MSLKSNITGRSWALSSLSKEGKNICGEVSGQLWLKYLKHATCKNQRSRDASYFIKGCRYNTALVEHVCFSSGLCFCKSILYTLFLPLLKRLLFCCFNSILFIFIVALTQNVLRFSKGLSPHLQSSSLSIFIISSCTVPFHFSFMYKTGPDIC